MYKATLIPGLSAARAILLNSWESLGHAVKMILMVELLQ
jgi:hypothetical protein